MQIDIYLFKYNQTRFSNLITSQVLLENRIFCEPKLNFLYLMKIILIRLIFKKTTYLRDFFNNFTPKT